MNKKIFANYEERPDGSRVRVGDNTFTSLEEAKTQAAGLTSGKAVREEHGQTTPPTVVTKQIIMG